MAKFPTAEVIKHSAYITGKYGYVKRSDDPNVECTADIVLDSMLDHSIDESELEKMNSRIIAWSNYIKNSKQDNEYITNVKAELGKPTIDEMKIGLIASSFASFDKYNQYKSDVESDKRSTYLGEEGGQIKFTISEHRLIKTGISKYNKDSKWYLYKIKDNNDNIIMYFADHNCEDDFENSSEAIATISKLTTFNDIKQTNVSKLRFL